MVDLELQGASSGDGLVDRRADLHKLVPAAAERADKQAAHRQALQVRARARARWVQAAAWR